ncbi:hypothetical protein A2382_04390 [Candidatus Woesebacteria bacterium RIFOXYB1_FULL_38_16]|uniref:PEGA domain-containing protein n=1 Tax=Candidatus Woesebacteria bacterium RIFOXYB1_FULL_38_16 TaxID=1802538 RepID=A0A1F8CVP7_9BACT|nr:MAG: hypothetical protein A2191_00930 [Candidatus Woesebacteria bacterium RIFOXYA1_FULL_38_9]OGM79808.1 MAG: hypothetical protein A2382_04390 [Candidatus Woesebacteria bacterium RIFOXYB1_FULL_38_16]
MKRPTSTKIGLVITLIASAIIILVVSQTYTFFTTKRLTITPVPDTSLIKINDTYETTGKFDKRLPKGVYQIIVSNEGYFTDTRSITLTNNLKIDISLKQIPQGKEVSSPNINTHPFLKDYQITSQAISENNIVGVSRTNGQLTTITNNTITSLYPGKIENFSYRHPYITFIETSKNNEIKILNIETKSINKLTTSDNEIIPIIFSTPSPDESIVYFLGSYSKISRKSTLFSTPFNEMRPTILFQTSANKVEFLTKDRLLLFTSREASDQSIVEVFDLNKKRVIFTEKANFYSISPDGNKIILENSLHNTIINLTNLQRNQIENTTLTYATWLNNETIITATNHNPGITFKLFNLKGYQISENIIISNLKDQTIQQIIGVSNNTIHFLNSEGKIISAALPQL